MIIYIGADHKGFQLKESVKNYLKNQGYEVADLGNIRYEEGDDYPDFAAGVAVRVSVDYENSRGILVCGSGVGMSVVANKFPKIRAGLITSPNQAFDAKSDDDINILVLPSDYITPEAAKKTVTTWLGTPFVRENRFLRRIDKIDAIEKQVIQEAAFRSDERESY